MKRKPRNAQTDRLTNARLFFLGYCILGVRASSLRLRSSSVMLCRCWRPRWAILCSSKCFGSTGSIKCSCEVPASILSLTIPDSATRIAARRGKALVFNVVISYAACACLLYHLSRVKWP